MEFALIAFVLYAAWCGIVELREERLCRLHRPGHGPICYASFPLWLILAPLEVLRFQAGPLGGNAKDLSRFAENPQPSVVPLPLVIKIPLIFLSLTTFVWSVWLLFGGVESYLSSSF